MNWKGLRWISRTFVDPDTKYQYKLPGAQTQSSAMAIIVGLFAALGGFIYGYDTGLSNNVLSMDYVIRHFSHSKTAFSASERAIATASLSLGTLFGSIVSPLLSDVYGRKFAILFAALIVFNIGNICQIASTSSPLLCVGRSITGTAIGVLSAVVPLYQSEASPKWVRGAIVSTYQWAITWGFFCSSAISQGTKNYDDSRSYRIPIGLQTGWALILSISLFFLPESPRFYVMKNKIPEAANALSILRRVPEDDPGLIEELVDIKATHDYATALTPYSYLDCFRSGPGRSKLGLRMFSGICLQALQQATGINFIFYYGVFFFVTTGVVKQPYLYSLISYAVNVISSIPGILSIELIGRRKSLIIGGIGMSVSSFIIAIVGTVSQSSSLDANKAMLAFVFIFIFFFASTWGPGVWVITSEIFPLGVRGRAVSLSAATNWLFNFGFAYVSPYLLGNDTDSTISLGMKIFFLWGSTTLIGTVFAYFFVYETKGLRLEEIDEMYHSCKNARDSVNFISTNSMDSDYDVIRNDITNEVNNNEFNNNHKKDLEKKKLGNGSSDGSITITNIQNNNNPQSKEVSNTTTTNSATIDNSNHNTPNSESNNDNTNVYGLYRTDIAPSISSSSASSNSNSISSVDLGTYTNLRDYVNNFQQRQFAQQNLQNNMFNQVVNNSNTVPPPNSTVESPTNDIYDISESNDDEIPSNSSRSSNF